MQIPELTDAPRRTFTPTGAAAKLPGYANPLISHIFGADPWALEYKGRVYLYLTGDIYEYDESGRLTENTCNRINAINIVSSSDLLNWTDHGPAEIAGPRGAAKWAENSWAPAVAHKVINGADRFFLYFANNVYGIGALTSNSPAGPWSDPLGKPLISLGIPGAEDVMWRSDPAVLVDDDGEGYLYFGGGLPSESSEDALHPRTARVIKLGADMISVSGEAVTIDAPAFFQDSGIHKRNGVYYYTYSSNFIGPRPKGYPGRGEIAYMTSDSPLGPFEYKGAIMKNPFFYFGVTGGNSHCIFSFKNKWHIAYHAQTLGKALGRVKGYRSPHINRLFYENDGRIMPVDADMKGAPLGETLNPYVRTEAETFAWRAGIRTAAKKGAGSENAPDMFVTHIRNGDWLAVANADFGDKGASGFTARVSSLTGGEIEIRADNPVDGEIIGTLAVGSTGGEDNWEHRSCAVNPIRGIRDVFFIFKGDDDGNLFDFDYWLFEGKI
jgi:arabinoxylan arabinofuranohydrolase